MITLPATTLYVLLLLVVALWLLGGKGWICAIEDPDGPGLHWRTQVLVYALWPALAAVAALGVATDALRRVP